MSNHYTRELKSLGLTLRADWLIHERLYSLRVDIDGRTYSWLAPTMPSDREVADVLRELDGLHP